MSHIDGGEEALRFMKSYLGWFGKTERDTFRRYRDYSGLWKEYMKKKEAASAPSSGNKSEGESKSQDTNEQSPVGKKAGEIVTNVAANADKTSAGLKTSINPEDAKYIMQNCFVGLLCNSSVLSGEDAKISFELPSDYMFDFVDEMEQRGISYFAMDMSDDNGNIMNYKTITIDRADLPNVKQFFQARNASIDNDCLVVYNKAFMDVLKGALKDFYAECDLRTEELKSGRATEEWDPMLHLGDTDIPLSSFNEIKANAEAIKSGKLPGFQQLSGDTPQSADPLSERQSQVSSPRITTETQEMSAQELMAALEEQSMELQLPTTISTRQTVETFVKGLEHLPSQTIPKIRAENKTIIIPQASVDFVNGLNEDVKGSFVISLSDIPMSNIKEFTEGFDSRQLLVVNGKEYLAFNPEDMLAFYINAFERTNTKPDLDKISDAVVVGDRDDFVVWLKGAEGHREYDLRKSTRPHTLAENAQSAKEMADEYNAQNKNDLISVLTNLLGSASRTDPKDLS